MASTLALGLCAAAVLAKLQTDSALLALVPVARITADAGPRPIYPYVLVEGSGEVPLNTLGGSSLPKFGSFARVQVRAVSQIPGETEAAAIIGAVKTALDGQPITVAGYLSAGVTFEDLIPLKDTVNGIVTREWIAEFEVTVSQS
jgi:hypothetical protein